VPIVLFFGLESFMFPIHFFSVRSSVAASSTASNWDDKPEHCQLFGIQWKHQIEEVFFMFHTELIQNTFSGAAAKEDVAAIIRHHRIQASPGYRAAAQYVLEELRRAGLETTIESYPASYQTSF
jgi:hypothetical protein